MLRQILVGGVASVATIVLHALAMTLVVRLAQIRAARVSAGQARGFTGIMVATVLLLMGVHLVEVLVWALAYGLVGILPAASATAVDLVYFAFVNYTTLGYGDMLPAAPWRLLGPMAAMNGVLMFGWSTAVIFEVLRKSLPPPTR